MNVLHFISLFVSQHTQLIELFVACVILFIILIIWKPKEKKETEVIPEENHPEPPSEDILDKKNEALNWWKTIDLSHKKLYAYDAQFTDRKISSLKAEEIIHIHSVFLENDSITTK